MRGAVATYDRQRGVGEIETSSGARLPFHCTAIADGSRQIDEGAAVVFRVGPGHHGRWEAEMVVRI